MFDDGSSWQKNSLKQQLAIILLNNDLYLCKFMETRVKSNACLCDLHI